ncbi:MAG: hypothetical protein ACREJ5_03125 [Geminicoccaceae bacterium]
MARRRVFQDHLGILSANRARLLTEATEDAVRWLGTENIGRKCPETCWLSGFADPHQVNGDLISNHKKTWSIQGVAGNPYELMAQSIRQAIAKRPTANLPADEARNWVATQVSELASELGKLAVACMKPRKDGKERTNTHTSWASKILHHAWPDVRTFVWDANALLALSTRLRRRLTVCRGYCYRDFLDECEVDLEDLRRCVEFQAGLNRLIRERGSVLRDHCKDIAKLGENDQRVISQDFLERRLYDKYLWAEGDFMKRK